MSILRRIFRSERKEAWKQLCSEIGAEFVDGGLGEYDEVHARVKQWTITLDIDKPWNPWIEIHYTRMRAPYVNKGGFKFKIYRRNVISDLRKRLGMQDIEVGDPDFDRDYIIQGNDEAKVRDLFAHPKIRQLIQDQPSFHLEVKDDEGLFGAFFPLGVDELYFRVEDIIKDVERLKGLYELFAEVLNQLCHIGSACENDPKLAL